MSTRYRWAEFSLDRESGLLMRGEIALEASRKVLDCLDHLIQNRERVVGYDELIHKLWGHDNVTNHQLSQVVLAARRAIGDDGQTQRAIRTVSGIGYRWVAEIRDDRAQLTGIADASAAQGHAVGALSEPSSGPAPEQSAAPRTIEPHHAIEPHRASAPAPSAAPAARRVPRQLIAASATLLVCAGIFALLPQLSETPAAAPEDITPTDPIAALKKAMRAGKLEDVRQGIANLPPHLADTPDARILEIELDFYRGRQQRAWDKLEIQLARREILADPVLHARLLVLKSKVSHRMDMPASQSVALAQAALDLLDSQAEAPPAARAEALERRGMAMNANGRHEEALSDLAIAFELYEGAGETQMATSIKSNIARVWMRTGRLHDALGTLEEVAERLHKNGERLPEMYTLNTMTRIQMELLRWDDALASSDRCMRLLLEAPDADRRFRALQLRAQALIGKGKLRLAASQLEEASGMRLENQSFNIPAQHLLASGDAAGALAMAANGFESGKLTDSADILLDGKDGALLIWAIAADALIAEGKPQPTPSAAQLERLRSGDTPLARIARGYWLGWQRRYREAETELRQALEASRRNNHPMRMTLAAEPLVAQLLAQDRPDAARAVVDALRAHDPERMDGEYRVNLMRLRVALGLRQTQQAIAIHSAVNAMAGERKLPGEVTEAYAEHAAKAGIAGSAGAH